MYLYLLLVKMWNPYLMTQNVITESFKYLKLFIMLNVLGKKINDEASAIKSGIKEIM